MSLHRTPLLAPLCALALTACSGTAIITPSEVKLELEPLPEQLAFLCVAPGCDTTKKVEVTSIGPRQVAIKRVLIAGEAKDDFTVTLDQRVPLVMGLQSVLAAEVRYAPKGAPAPGTVHLVVSYTDASAADSADRGEPGELKIPLVRRLVGEPWLAANPESLSFGTVEAGTSKTLAVTVKNQGYGNVVAELASVDTGDPAVRADLPAARSLATDAGVELPVTFTPPGESYVKTTVEVRSSSAHLAPVKIAVEGTSLRDAHLQLDNATEIDFGELAHREQRTVTRQLMNQGGKPLAISGLTLTDPTGNVKATLPGGVTTVTLAPLERVPLTVALDAKRSGALAAQLVVRSNDPASPQLTIPIKAQITEPNLTFWPFSLAWGNVPKGWAVKKTLELRNSGHGALTLKNISLVRGSSNLFTVTRKPDLPSVLQEGEMATVELEYRAESLASFAGTLSVESNDPDEPFAEVPLSATGTSCEVGCPIANGTPVCRLGSCEVKECNAGWHDADQSANNGCECKEPEADVGPHCDDAKQIGVLKDSDGAEARVTGILPAGQDVDAIRFYAADVANIPEKYRVRIRLESNDPGIRLCIFHLDSNDPNLCSSDLNEECPSSRSYERVGNPGGNDGAVYLIKVRRDPGAKGNCIPYTVYMSNGR